MATEVLELQIRTTGVSAATGGFRSIAAGASSATKNIELMTSSLRFMRQALVALSFARIFEGIGQGITSAQESLNLLRTVTPNIQQAGAAFEHFLDVANETRTPLNDIVKLAVQVSRTIADGPNKLQQVDAITKNIAESFSIAGANGQSVRNVIRDINEMFAGGTVIMRQFRAILQQDRPLIDAVAKGVTATGAGAQKFNAILDNARKNNSLSGGTLTEALKAVPGALLGSDVQRALEHDATLTKQFANTAVTLGQALTQLNNNWEGFLKHVNDATSGLDFLAKSVQFVAQHIPLIVALTAAIAGLLVVDIVLKAMANLGGILLSVFDLAIAPVKVLTRALFGILDVVIAIAATAVTGLVKLPGLLFDMSSAALQFSRDITSAAIATARFLVELPITILNGVTRSIIYLGESAGVTFKAVSELAETSVFTISTAFKDLVSVFGDVVTATGSVGSAFVALASGGVAAIGTVIESAFASLLSTMLELVPAFLALAVAAVPLLALGTSIYAAVKPLGQVGTAVDALGFSFSNVAGIVLATIEVIASNFKEFTSVLSALWSDMINGFLNQLNNFGNELQNFERKANDVASGNVYDLLFGKAQNSFSQGAAKPTNTATPILDDLVKKIKTQVPIAQAQIEKILGPFEKQFFALINGTGDTPPGAKPHGNGFDSALASLTGLIAKIEPYYAGVARLAEVQKVFNKAAKEGVDVNGVLARAGLTRADVLTREIRSVVGAGNADTDYAGKVKLLSKSLDSGAISLSEFTRLAREAQEALLKTKFDTGSGVLLAFLDEEDRALGRSKIASEAVNKAFEAGIDPVRDYATTVDALNQAVAKNPALLEGATKALVESRLALLATRTDLSSGEEISFIQHYKEVLDQAKIGTDVFNEAFAKDSALNTYLVKMKALSDAVNLYGLNQERATELTRDFQLELLSTNTDALSGFQSGVLTAQKTMNNFAQTASTTVTDAFNDMTDALTTFFDTGTLNADQFFGDILKNLTKLAVQQEITGPLSNLLGFGPGGQGGIAGSGGLLSSLFGGSGIGGAIAGGTLGSSSSNAMWVQLASGAGAIPGSGGLLSSLFGGSGGTPTAPGPDPILDNLDGTFTQGAQTLNTGISGALNNSGGDFISKLGSLFSGSGGLFSSGGFFANLFSGAGGGLGSSSGGILDFFSSLGFATSGSFRVGGSGGQDSQLVPLKLTPGEVVNVKHDSDMQQGDSGNGGASIGQVTFVMPPGTDMNTFRRSQGQITSRLASSMARAHARNA